MNLDTFLTIVFLVVGIISYALYCLGTENVYLKYKDQKVRK